MFSSSKIRKINGTKNAYRVIEFATIKFSSASIPNTTFRMNFVNTFSLYKSKLFIYYDLHWLTLYLFGRRYMLTLFKCCIGIRVFM